MEKKLLPFWALVAYRSVEEHFDEDLDEWPTRARTKVLVAALDAEPLGEHAIEIATHDAAKAILEEWRRKTRPVPKKRRRGMATRAVCAVLLIAAIASAALMHVTAVPVRKPAGPIPPELPTLKITQVSGEWPPYTIHQAGRAVIIESDNWCANGWIQPDGSIMLNWVSPGGQRVASVYRLDDAGVLRGEWVWESSGVHVCGGRLRGETIYRDDIWRKP